jgi:hypothetical protein
VIDDDKGCTFKSYTHGASAVVTNSGAAATTYQGGAPVITFVNGGTLTLNVGITCIINTGTSGNIYTVTAGSPTINGSSNFILQGLTGITSVSTHNLPTITFGGTILVRIQFAGSADQTITMTGDLTFATGNTFSIRSTQANPLVSTFSTGGFSILGYPSINFGRTGTSTASNISLGASTIQSSLYTGTTFANGTNVNMGTCQWSNTGNWTWNVNDTITGTAATTSVTITNTSSITSNTKAFPGSLIINAATKTITMIDALSVASALTLTAGTLNTATFAVTVTGNFSVAGTSTYTGTGTTLTVTGNYTLSATCTYTVGTSVTFNAAAGTQLVTTNGKTISPVIHNGAGGTVQLQDALTTTTLTLTAGAFDQNAKAIVCTALTWNSNAAGTALSGTIACSGNIARGAASAGTQAGVITLTGAAATITSNATTWGPITYNNGAGAFTLVDAFACGALILTAGTATLTGFNTICASVAVNGTSVLNITGRTFSVSGNMTLAAGSTFTINAASVVYFTGVVGTQLITSNGKTFPATIHQGAATAQLQDAFVCAGFTLTSGTFDQNGQSITCTAFTWNTVAVTTDLDGAISCSGNITRGAASAGSMTGTLTVTGTCTATQNGQSWGPFVLNSGVNTLTCADAFAGSSLTLTSGIFNPATFAVTMTGNVAINGTSTLTASGSTCNFGGDYTTAAGSTITINAATNYTFTKNGAIVTTNGKALPQVTFNSNFSINDTCTIARLIRGVDGFTGTFEAGQTFTISNLAAANWSGAAAALNYTRSSIPGTQFTMVLPNAVTLTYYDSQDCIYQGFDVTANNGTSATQGNNVRYLTMNVVTMLPANGTTAGGDLLTFTDTGNGMGGNMVVTVGGVGAIGETVITTQSSTAVTSPGAAGVVNVVITNGDGDTRTLVGAYTYATPVSGVIEGGSSRCYIGGPAIGI